MISLEAVLYVVLGLIGGRLVDSSFILPYIAPYYYPLLKHGISPLAYFFDVVAIGGFIVYLIRERLGWNNQQRIRFVVASAIISIVVSIIFLTNAHTYYSRMIGSYDGAIQTEIAATAIVHGQNPYTFNYRGTEFEDYLRRVGMVDDPMLDHYAYPPLVPILSIPTLGLAKLTHTEPQMRLVGLVAICMACWLLMQQSGSSITRLRIALLTIFNPLVYVYALVGFNDGLYIFFTILSAILVRQRRWMWAGATIGLSLASKQTAWLFVPLWAGLLFSYVRQKRIQWANIRNIVLGASVATLLCYGPFLIANASALYDDTVRFVTSAAPGVHAIAGISLWQIPVLLGYYQNEGEFIPTAIVQIIVAAVLFPIATWRVFRRPSLSFLFYTMVVALYVFGLFNRYFYEHYFTSYILLVVAGMVFHEQEGAEHTTSMMPSSELHGATSR